MIEAVTPRIEPFVPVPIARFPVRHAALATLLAYWESLAGGRMPERGAFDPVDLPGEVWPRLFLVEFLPEAQDYRLRVQGSYIVDVYRRDFTGCRFVETEIPRITESVSFALLERMRGTGEPQYHFGRARFRTSEDFREVEELVLPLAGGDGRVAYAIGAIDFPLLAYPHLRPFTSSR
jgi:hypothetical protein